MPSVHARLSPSASSRWLNCPGSLRLSDQCQKDETTIYAEEGTRAHSVAEAKLKKHNGERARAKKGDNREMDEATDFYVDYVTEAQSAVNGTLLVEQRFSLAEYFPDCFGTADAVVIGDKTLEVIDLKYGKGIRVDARGNTQLMLYGLGTISLFEGLYDISKVKLTIIQPRLDHISTWETEINTLKGWGHDIAPIARRALAGCDDYAVGDWCRFCPAKVTCRTRADYFLSLEKHKFKEPDLLGDDEIGDVLKRGESLSDWTKSVKDYVYSEALRGKKFDGWKLVEGRSNRVITNPVEAANRLSKAGIPDEDIWKIDFNGITALEKNIGKKRLVELIGDLIEKPEGKPTLVREEDTRKELNTVEKAKEDFDNE